MLDYKDRLLVSIADVVTTANWLAFWGEHGLGFEPVFDPAETEEAADLDDEDDGSI